MGGKEISGNLFAYPLADVVCFGSGLFCDVFSERFGNDFDSGQGSLRERVKVGEIGSLGIQSWTGCTYGILKACLRILSLVKEWLIFFEFGSVFGRIVLTYFGKGLRKMAITVTVFIVARAVFRAVEGLSVF